MANAPLGTVLRHLRGLTQTHATEAVTDGQLLERFTANREEAAFAALLRRHGPMVLGVARRVLGQAQDAEDVLQATFLLLARKAGSIRRGEAVSGWLHAVAFRLAVRARGQQQMRQKREHRAAARRPPGPDLDVAWRELLAVLDEELGRLPSKYRTPLVLCYLEGKTQEEAQRQLGCPLGTVRSWLARARQLLRDRLTRRGLTLSSGTLAALLAANPARAALPGPLFQATLRAGLQFAAGGTGTGGVSAQAAALVKGGLKTMAGTKLKFGTMLLLLAGLVMTGAVVLAHSAGPGRETRPAPTAAQTRDGRQAPQQEGGGKSRSEPEKPAPRQEARQMTLTGRVLTPDGKPAAQARVALVAVSRANGEEVLGTARANSEGRFRLAVRRTTSGAFYSAVLVAAAKGYGLAWQNLHPDTKQLSWDLRLWPEQVVRGRLVDLQGNPAAGVKLHFFGVGDPKAKENIQVFLWNAPKDLALWPGPLTTDAQGRFVLHSLGRNLLFGLRVRDDHFAWQDWHRLATGDGKKAKEATLLLEPPRFVEGRVTCADTGKPVPGAAVMIRCFTRRPNESSWDLGAATCRADTQGRFRTNSFPGTHILVSADGPAGTPYLGVSRDLAWPKETVKQQVNLALVRGVLVRGQVTETPSGKPVARVRVTFFPQLTGNKFYRGDVSGGGGESGPDGRFQMIIQPGPGTLIFRSSERKHIQHLVYRDFSSGKFSAAPTRKRFEQAWNIDALHALNLKPGAKSAEVKVVLRRGQTVHGRLLGPDGKPVARVRMLCPVPSASVLTEFTPVEFPDGRFTLTGCDPDKTYPALFLDAKHQWGAVALIPGKQAKGKPLIVRLAPCGSVVVRLLDRQGRPLKNYRPNPYGFQILVPHAFATDPKARGEKPPAAWLFQVSFDRRHYPNPNGLKTDAEGRITFPALIPGVTYQFSERGEVLEFKAASGKPLNLADLKLRYVR
jgi:RNA polymerase sigma factor (sigma-70 family)